MASPLGTLGCEGGTGAGKGETKGTGGGRWTKTWNSEWTELGKTASGTQRGCECGDTAQKQVENKRGDGAKLGLVKGPVGSTGACKVEGLEQKRQETEKDDDVSGAMGE